MLTEHGVENVEHLGDTDVLDVVDRADEIFPEIRQYLLPRDFVVRNLVELFFKIGGEIEFHIAREVILEEGHYDATLVLAMQPLLLKLHIAAILQHLNDRCVGGRTADAEFFHALDQRGFREARRGLGEMLGDVELLALDRFALVDHRQALAVFIFWIVVAAFLIDREEAVELHDLTGGAQFEHARASLGGDVHGGAFEFGRFHLARDGAHPDQFIEPELVVIEASLQRSGAARQIGRPDRFVSFLRVLGLGGVLARRIRDVRLAVVLTNDLADLRNRFGSDRDTVGTHISNETCGLSADIDAFIKTLRNSHGVRGRETELAAGFLLQG